jgi:GTP-binding protein LepA
LRGALLLVDATQGIQAQTISNLSFAVDHNLEIIPIVNKVDMDSAMIEEVQDQIIDLIGCEREDLFLPPAGQASVSQIFSPLWLIEYLPPKAIRRLPCKP